PLGGRPAQNAPLARALRLSGDHFVRMGDEALLARQRQGLQCAAYAVTEPGATAALREAGLVEGRVPRRALRRLGTAIGGRGAAILAGRRDRVGCRRPP